MSVNEDMLVSYALGHLTPEEEAQVEAQLWAHPEDAATVAAYLESLSELVLALPPEPLPENGEAELLARVRAASEVSAAPEESQSAPQRRPLVLRYAWVGALAAAAALAVYLSVFSPLDPDVRVARELQNYSSEPGAVSYALTGEGQSEPLGTLVRLSDGRVFVALEAPPEGERVYQAWDIAEAPVSLGTFDGRTFLSSAAVSEGNTFGLTLEPPGGSEQPTTTPLTLIEL